MKSIVIGLLMVALLGMFALGDADAPCLDPVRAEEKLLFDRHETQWYLIEQISDNLIRVVALDLEYKRWSYAGYGEALSCAIRIVATVFLIRDIIPINYASTPGAYGAGSFTKELYLFVELRNFDSSKEE